MPEDQIQLRIAGCTDTGIRRQHNEDHIGYNQDLGIAVLADGMGGHQSGEIASHMAVESVLESLKSMANGDASGAITSSQLLEFVSNTISDSNSLIFNAAEQLEQHRGMGTTLVATMIQGGRLYAGHVGDSRLYLYRNQSLSRVTKDHSLVQDLVDRGFYTEEEARVASVGHIVTRALGTKPEVEVDTLEKDLEPGDVLLLCSDGLSDMVADWHIEEMLREGEGELEQTAQRLVDQSNRNGGKDNISVILIQVSRPTAETDQR
ncbi:MAG: Stp1/IreP family PP2C-type Ser/Thr phosphatase [Pseudomonadales bacterium]|nr:Stp1/IreP family PP2C-type Ser/Thr phosphatase [Pseudomonadales bacterium]